VLKLFPERFAIWESFRVSHEAGPHRAHRLVFVAPFFYGRAGKWRRTVGKSAL
jgi:hypothetical protein